MKRRSRLALLVLAIIAAGLLVPVVLRDPPARRIAGPDLSGIPSREVAFMNGELALAGLLILPSGDGPFPGAVFIHGSGSSRRDNPWYLTVASDLRDNGVAVLLPDKRGSERSGGDWRGASLDELATDTEAALEFLALQPSIDPAAIGVVGFSQGGWIAPIAAARTPDIAFVVSMSGAGVTSEEQLLFEEVSTITDLGTYRALARLIAPFTARRIRQTDTWRPFAGFDPMPYWAQVSAPVFAAFGGGDKNLPVEESVRRFQTLGDNVLVRVYPDGGHGIADPETGRVKQVFLGDLVAFIRSATAPPASD